MCFQKTGLEGSFKIHHRLCYREFYSTYYNQQEPIASVNSFTKLDYEISKLFELVSGAYG